MVKLTSQWKKTWRFGKTKLKTTMNLIVRCDVMRHDLNKRMNAARFAKNTFELRTFLRQRKIDTLDFFEGAMQDLGALKNLLKLDFENVASDTKIYKLLQNSFKSGNLALLARSKKPWERYLDCYILLCFREIEHALKKTFTKSFLKFVIPLTK